MFKTTVWSPSKLIKLRPQTGRAQGLPISQNNNHQGRRARLELDRATAARRAAPSFDWPEVCGAHKARAYTPERHHFRPLRRQIPELQGPSGGRPRSRGPTSRATPHALVILLTHKRLARSRGRARAIPSELMPEHSRTTKAQRAQPGLPLRKPRPRNQQGYCQVEDKPQGPAGQASTSNGESTQSTDAGHRWPHKPPQQISNLGVREPPSANNSARHRLGRPPVLGANL